MTTPAEPPSQANPVAETAMEMASEDVESEDKQEEIDFETAESEEVTHEDIEEADRQEVVEDEIGGEDLDYADVEDYSDTYGLGEDSEGADEEDGRVVHQGRTAKKVKYMAVERRQMEPQVHMSMRSEIQTIEIEPLEAVLVEPSPPAPPADHPRIISPVVHSSDLSADVDMSAVLINLLREVAGQTRKIERASVEQEAKARELRLETRLAAAKFSYGARMTKAAGHLTNAVVGAASLGLQIQNMQQQARLMAQKNNLTSTGTGQEVKSSGGAAAEKTQKKQELQKEIDDDSKDMSEVPDEFHHVPHTVMPARARRKQTATDREISRTDQNKEEKTEEKKGDSGQELQDSEALDPSKVGKTKDQIDKDEAAKVEADADARLEIAKDEKGLSAPGRESDRAHTASERVEQLENKLGLQGGKPTGKENLRTEDLEARRESLSNKASVIGFKRAQENVDHLNKIIAGKEVGSFIPSGDTKNFRLLKRIGRGLRKASDDVIRAKAQLNLDMIKGGAEKAQKFAQQDLDEIDTINLELARRKPAPTPAERASKMGEKLGIKDDEFTGYEKMSNSKLLDQQHSHISQAQGFTLQAMKKDIQIKNLKEKKASSPDSDAKLRKLEKERDELTGKAENLQNQANKVDLEISRRGAKGGGGEHQLIQNEISMLQMKNQVISSVISMIQSGAQFAFDVHAARLELKAGNAQVVAQDLSNITEGLAQDNRELGESHQAILGSIKSIEDSRREINTQIFSKA